MNPEKLITCILPKGTATPMLKALRMELGVVSANINNARGMGKITPLAHRGLGDQPEKEVLSLVVAADAADQAFEFIYFEAGINEPHGGIIYMSRLNRATPFTLPDELPEEA